MGLSVLAALVVWLGVAASSPGYVADIESRKARAKWVTEEGIEDAYRMRIDYPPGNLYLFKAVGHLYQRIADPSFDRRRAADSQLLTFLIKLPPTLFHVATAGVVFVLVRRRASERLAWLSATILLFDPAAILDVAHQGQYDPVHTLFSLLAVAALSVNRPFLAGAAIGLAAVTKPQSWILLPLVATFAWRHGGMAGLLRATAGGVLALVVTLAPFITSNRVSHLVTRLPEYMQTNSTANHVISANAHNLWWLPTLVQGRWIDDWELLVGPLSYRLVGVGLVLAVLALCLARAWRRDAPADHFLLAATLSAGWFFFTPRAHEYHAFFLLPFLAVAWPSDRRLALLYGIASVSLAANLVLHDPLLLGAFGAPPELAGLPDPANPPPVWYRALTLVNVGLFAACLGGLVAALRSRRLHARPVAWREARVAG